MEVRMDWKRRCSRWRINKERAAQVVVQILSRQVSLKQ